ncbi:small acid-soluble spore protein SspI [Bacillus horti]|uniref:Small, acid-soluble spore protein I n=1 Tax=Caldalkalibacillus horti TaxID=77523 RepID=A0ABT9VWL3_9BACI|nr:small acid-soluble spore protein SspI [Bacillus horti]MDQ0165385.1 small acid-soluble spore protein I (minor) [Bacillus horti]
MNLNLRHAIVENLNGSDEEHIRATILDAIESGEEKMLPGLGVLFELMWDKSSNEEKELVISHIKAGLQ